MDLEHILKSIGQMQKAVAHVKATLRDISRLDADRIANLAKLPNQLAKLENELDSLRTSGEVPSTCAGWLQSYRRELDDAIATGRRTYGAELEQELQQRGLSLAGQYPDLKCGLFTLEVDFDKRCVGIWFGPKQERLDRCDVSPGRLADRLVQLRAQLGSDLQAAAFLEDLRMAYTRSAEGKQGKDAPIISVLFEMALLLQSPRFREDPATNNYHGYGRAKFSYDLFRLRQENLHGMSLVVAVRAFTRKRRDFLWVPDDESGAGTTYSHLRCAGVKA